MAEEITQTTGEQGADAGLTQEPDRAAEFEKLIGGEYKKAYDERVQSIVRSRVKNYREKLDRMEPLVQKLAQTYGTEDPDALLKALEPAPKPGVSAAAWAEQVDRTRQRYPDLDMRRELTDDRFRQLVLNGVDVRTAYETVHQDRILTDAMRWAAQAARQDMAEVLAANGRRPAEGGSLGAAGVRSSVAALTRADMADIERRVRSGERVSFA